MTPETISILGIRVHDVTMNETIEAISEFVSSGQPHLVITLGTEMVMLARKNLEFKNLINMSPLVIPDGSGLLWASRRLGKPLREKVAGIDLVERLCALSGRKGWKIFFLGGKPGVAERAASNLRKRFPDIQIAGTHHGYFEKGLLPEPLQSAKTDILLAGMGFPAQEEWLSKHLKELSIPVGIGVGGSFDILAGNLKRAPVWMINLNLEWLFRLFQEPRRIGRILTIPRFVLSVYMHMFVKKDKEKIA